MNLRLLVLLPECDQGLPILKWQIYDEFVLSVRTLSDHKWQAALTTKPKETGILESRFNEVWFEVTEYSIWSIYSHF
jgi:hypothetical protein